MHCRAVTSGEYWFLPITRFTSSFAAWHCQAITTDRRCMCTNYMMVRYCTCLLCSSRLGCKCSSNDISIKENNCRPWESPRTNPKRNRLASGRKLSIVRHRARDAFRLGRRGLNRRPSRYNAMQGHAISDSRYCNTQAHKYQQ